jgi:Domain of unknown function DUF29
MGSEMQNLYDQDFYCWALETASALRPGRIGEVDLYHVAEEIEGMANRDLRVLKSRLERILEHKLKLQFISGPVRERNEATWTGSISRQQSAIEDLLAQSPSLRPRVQELIPGAYEHAARTATRSFRVATPAECPWGKD